jgi:hypothetical protein
VNAPFEVFISAAREDGRTARALADALSTHGITSVASTEDRPGAETVLSLESGRVLVLVLSAAANSSVEVVRALERAAGRGIPIITYAIEDVSPSPSISYFTATVQPIAAWGGGDPGEHTRTLVEAAKRSLTASPQIARPAQGRRPAYGRLIYRDSRELERAVAGALAILAAVSAYALYRDAGFVLKHWLGSEGIPRAAAADYLGAAQIISAAGVWCVIGCAIACFRRARLNLLALFATVPVSGREIVWRPMVPFANVVWLPRICNDLWRASDPAAPDATKNWALPRYWSTAFLCTYSLGSVRDLLLSYVPQRAAIVIGASAALDAGQILTAALTYAVLARLLARVRDKQHARLLTPRSAPAAGTASSARDVLVISAPDDQSTATSIARVLEDGGCRCWRCLPTVPGAPPASAVFTTFAAVLVVVSRASHSSESIVATVQFALAARVPVIPFVIDPPPSGSSLGHYIRSLHWIDGAAGVAALEVKRIRNAFALAHADSPSTVDGARPPGADNGFTRLLGATSTTVHYRPAVPLRTTATLLAILQVTVAAFAAIAAIAIALNPEGADPAAPLNISTLLVVGSLPAWLAFLPWVWITHRNARVLLVGGLAKRRWLLVQVAVPGVSLVAGGRAIGRLWESIEPPPSGTSWLHARGTWLQVAWTCGSIVWIAAAIISWMLAQADWIVAAMLVSAGQCVATLARGALRVHIVRRIGARLDVRSRGARG